MGEKIRNLSTFTVNGKEVAIELNDGYSKGYSKYDIHIQSEAIQYSMTDRDFMKLASTLYTSARIFETMKGEKGCQIQQ